jgi:hypothetical protein
MTVDMHEWRFRQELEKLREPFTPNDERNEEVWAAEFPAWRALFSAMCLFGHSTGYRLPSFNQFSRYCRHAYTVRHPDRARFVRFFSGSLGDGMQQRLGAWYESGMAETYLYSCLVDAIEDLGKLGLVLYDPRADWKLKADLIVIVNGKAMRVSAFVGHQEERHKVEARRDGIERERKKNTMDSAHWGNAELAAMPIFEIARTGRETQVVGGVRLFALPAVNRLLTAIYTAATVDGPLLQIR